MATLLLHSTKLSGEKANLALYKKSIIHQRLVDKVPPP